MSDFRRLTAAEPWLVADAAQAVVGELSRPFEPAREFAEAFPTLTRLLSSARRSSVTLPTGRFVLFAWGEQESELRAWLSPASPAKLPVAAAPDHRVLLAHFGGITERFNESGGNWLLNHNDALTAAEVGRDASFLTAYAWAFEGCGGIPIGLTDYYPAAWEANGNCVLCSRADGELLFFAPDHSYDDLLPYRSCPPYTLYTRQGAATLRQWVEAIAGQWSV